MEKNIKWFAIIALLFALGLVLPSTTTTGVQWIVNNTNLAPDAGAPHPPGTGARVSGVTYWANNSPIELFVFAHAANTSDTAEIHLSINGTIVADTSGRPLGAAENSNKTIIATIPQYSNYSVEFFNFHHYEWREYQILTGEVTTNITTSTGTGAGCEGNCSFDGVWMNSIRKNNTSDAYGAYINLSAPFGQYGTVENDIFTHFTMHTGDYYTLQSTNTTSGNYSIITGTSEGLTIAVTDTLSNNWNMYPDHTRYLIDTREYILNQSELSLGGANLTNCNNCWNETVNNSKVNKSGDNMTGTLNITKINDTYVTFNDGKGFFNVFEKDNSTTQRTQLSQTGTQWWRMRTGDPGNNSTNGNVGYIFYSTPSSKPGINFFNDSIGHRMTLSMCPAEDCLLLASSVGGSAPTSSIRVYPNGNLTVDGNITINGISGVGNAYTCVDSNGKLYRGSPGC